MSKKSVITLFEKSLSSPKSIPFRVEAPIISPYKFLIMNLSLIPQQFYFLKV